MEQKLRIVPGAGTPIPVSMDVARNQNGTVEQALRRIFSEIRDPGLLALLEDPRSSLELFSVGPDGQGHEALLNRTQDWREVVERVEQATCEIGISKRMTGGSGDGPGSGYRRSPGFYHVTQEFVSAPADYSLTAADSEDVEAGRKLFVTGAALAAAEYICRLVADHELLWYWIASAGRPQVISGLKIPCQHVSHSFCTLGPREVLRVSRAVRQEGGAIVGAGHSHGRGCVFSSAQDLETLRDLAAERVGSVTSAPLHAEGIVSEAPDGDGRRFIIKFEAGPTVALSVKHDGIGAGDLAASSGVDSTRVVSVFSTHNARREHLFPTFTLKTCTQCGNRPEAVHGEVAQVVVVGPRVVTREERRRLATAVRENVRLAKAWRVQEVDDEEEPAEFSVVRHGCEIGRVPAGLMEKAAHSFPEIAVALGWASRNAACGAKNDGQ